MKGRSERHRAALAESARAPTAPALTVLNELVSA
jgi:hypothetical protein